MTFYLERQDDPKPTPPTVKPEDVPPADTAPASFGDVFSAAWKAETIRTDAWSYAEKQRRDLALEMLGKLPDDARQRVLDRRWDHENNWISLGEMVTDEVAKLAKDDPGTWANYPLTPDAFNARIDERRKKDLEEAENVLGLPGGGLAEFLGTGARAMTDATSVALAPLGLSGAPLRVIAGEAFLGGLGEALVLPREYDVARELDLEKPNALNRILLGTAAGAGLSSAFIGIERAARYALTRRAASRESVPAWEGQLEHEAKVQQAIDQMLGRPRPGQVMQEEAATGAPLNMSKFNYKPGGNASPRRNRVGYVFGKLLELGYEPHQAAGLVGNLIQESGASLNTRAVGDSGAAFGMGQWNGPRRDALLAFAQARKLDPADVDTQIAFLDYELKGPEAEAWAKISQGRDAAEVATLASNLFWRPGVPHLANRVGYARDVFGQYEGGNVPRWRPGTFSDDLPTGYITQGGYTAPGTITAGDNFRIDVSYEVVDARTLYGATADLQPRDRTRAQSDEQIAEIAANLDPMRLMPAPEADRGAPIVAPDNIIESGNGRVQAINRVYDQYPDRAEAYRQQIQAFGFEIPAGVERPVLIARRQTELDQAGRRDFVARANNSQTLRMTATERARITGGGIDADLLAKFDPTVPLTARGNAAFVRGALGAIPQAERGAFTGADGALNADGIRAIKHAIFARAYDAPDILARYAETNAGEFRTFIDALEQASPAWAALRSAIAAGNVRAEFDLTPFILDAMRLVANARELAAVEKMPLVKALEELLGDNDLLNGAVDPLTAALVGKFWRGGRAARAEDVAAFLTRYADEARKIGDTSPALLGDAPGPVDALKAIDPEAFSDLTEIPLRPGERAPAAATDGDLPPEAYSDGAMSPDAEIADQAVLAAWPKVPRSIAGREDLEAEFIGRDDPYWGLEYDDEQEYTKFTETIGYSVAQCTGYACTIGRRLPKRAQVYGFMVHENPTATLLGTVAEGHDFAVLDGRWIVDPWVVDLEAISERGVFDLEDAGDAGAIAELYGDPALWKRAQLEDNGNGTAGLTFEDKASGFDPNLPPRADPDPQRGLPPATEEDLLPPEDIRMPIDDTLPADQVRAQIRALTNENRPIVRDLIARIDEEFGTKSGENVKALSKVTQKAQRPSILAKKPWHTVAHIRDTYRFKTVIQDFRDVPAIFQRLLDAGIQLVKIDTNKLFEPKEWGWRIIAFDLRMPNGQLVEWYLPIAELEAAKKARGHLIFEEWRNKSEEQLLEQWDAYQAGIRKSFEGYDQAFTDALDRIGVTRQDAAASWASSESSMLEAARKSRSSSGVTTSEAERGLATQDPSASRNVDVPSDQKATAREVPGSKSARSSSAISEKPPQNESGGTQDIGAAPRQINDYGDNLEIVLPDGTKWTSGEILDDLEGDLALADLIEACPIGEVANGAT